MHTLNDLFIEQLRDIYNAEKQLVDAMPQMANTASSPRLQGAFRDHLEQTREQVERLQRVFSHMGMSPDGKKCEAMEGLIEEATSMMKKNGDADVKDAALIAQAQRIEHYEISAYGTLCTYAEQLGHQDALTLLERTLNEEKKTDARLSNLAINTINPQAEEQTHHRREEIFDGETIVALYEHFSDARAAIEELVNEGFDRHRLSLIASDDNEQYSTYVRDMDINDTTEDPDAGDGAGFGAVVGTLTGLGIALIPGLGGFVVAGAAGAALFSGIGAATGAIVGGITAGLVDLGVDEERAEYYTTRMREGGVLVLAHTNDEWGSRAASIMRNHNPVDMDEVERNTHNR